MSTKKLFNLNSNLLFEWMRGEKQQKKLYLETSLTNGKLKLPGETTKGKSIYFLTRKKEEHLEKGIIKKLRRPDNWY